MARDITNEPVTQLELEAYKEHVEAYKEHIVSVIESLVDQVNDGFKALTAAMNEDRAVVGPFLAQASGVVGAAQRIVAATTIKKIERNADGEIDRIIEMPGMAGLAD